MGVVQLSKTPDPLLVRDSAGAENTEDWIPGGRGPQHGQQVAGCHPGPGDLEEVPDHAE